MQGGELGKINYVYSNRLNLGRIRTEENILWSFAPHDISVMLMLLNEMPVRVASQGGNYLHRSIADVTVSNFQFASGVSAHIFVSWLHPFKEQKLVVVGERQMAVFDDMASSNKLMLYPHRIQWVNRMPIPEKQRAFLSSSRSRNLWKRNADTSWSVSRQGRRRGLMAKRVCECCGC